MDKESAENSEKLIQNNIEAIEKWRENLPELEKQLNDDESLKAEGFSFLERIAFPRGVHNRSPLAPDVANYFYNGANIYDNAYLVEGIVTDQNGEIIQPYGTEIELENDFIFDFIFDKASLSGKILSGLEQDRDEPVQVGFLPSDADFIIIESLNKNRI